MTLNPWMERTHRNGCPALSAWDVPDACNCDRPLLCTLCNRETTNALHMCVRAKGATP